MSITPQFVFPLEFLKNRLRFFLLFSAFVLGASSLSGCIAAPEDLSEDDVTPDRIDEAIVHGAPDRGRHPSVLALVAQDEDGSTSLCTASLIAPDLVLTARHCVADLVSASIDCNSSSRHVRRMRDPSRLVLLDGDVASRGEVLAHGTQILAPPGDICGADLALVRLDRRLSRAVIPVTKMGYPRVNDSLTVVGFGQTGDDGLAGNKRFRTGVPVVSTTRAEFEVGESTCSGDSGGPALDETGAIVGVVSRGRPACEGPHAGNIFTRVDMFLDLIRTTIGSEKSSERDPAPPTPTSDMGDECMSGDTCATGLCVRPGPGAGYCTRTCGGGGPRCPRGYRCKPGGKMVCAKS